MHLEDLLTPLPRASEQTPSVPWPQRVAMLSVHTSPLAALGGRDTGGMNVYLKSLAMELARRGIAVDVYTRRMDKATPSVEMVAPGFRTISVAAGPASPVSREALVELLPEFVARVEALRASEDITYDVLHSHYWISGLAAASLASSWQVQWLHMSHTLAVLKNAHRGPNQPLEPPERLRAEEQVLHAADGLSASNTVERDEILSYYQVPASRVFITPCGCDISLFRPGNRSEARRELDLDTTAPLVLYVGRIEPLKGLDTLVRATALLRHYKDRLQVLIVGGSRDPADTATAAEVERLQALVKGLGLDGTVRFIGPVPQQALPSYYRAAHVTVVPSHYESFGMAALESMACGTPVVASRVGGLQVTVRDGQNGYLVPAGNERAFARKLDLVLSRPVLAARLGQNAARLARRYSWRRVADANLGAYHNLQALRFRQETATIDGWEVL